MKPLKLNKCIHGFPLLASSGQLIGYVESVDYDMITLKVVGWTICDDVTLVSGADQNKVVPNIVRPDVSIVCPELNTLERGNEVGFEATLDTTPDTAFILIHFNGEGYYFQLEV
ncbi:hypothetical protein SAMN04487859_102250 [Roseovarius lutimaris]|uniref:Uncharacterized protein n=1 Tax=Roseovarius lutimaris TaxID=1005928 RepID=A0A1I4Z2W2_9RHOB|nr:hypothetical protein [Roseovarius lutimaris]SFN44538.1 hypothetical protein SAMN04487859_102250 [Roseovarius lutimaris]